MLRLTYREIGERLGLTTDAARQLTRRRKWPRGSDGGGRTLITVSAEELARCSSSPLPDGRLEGIPANGHASLPPPHQDGARSERATLRRELLAYLERIEQATRTEREAERAERARLAALLEEVTAARTRESAEWQRAVNQLKAELAATRASESRAQAELVKARLEEANAKTAMKVKIFEHQRALADALSLYEAQREDWKQERHRLEARIRELEARGFLAPLFRRAD